MVATPSSREKQVSRIHPVPLVGLLVLALNLCSSHPAAAQPDGESPSTARLQFGATTSTPGDAVEYRVLATSRTSTMERELNEAAEEDFRFQAVMGGNTAFGGSEAVVIVSRARVRARRSAIGCSQHRAPRRWSGSSTRRPRTASAIAVRPCSTPWSAVKRSSSSSSGTTTRSQCRWSTCSSPRRRRRRCRKSSMRRAAPAMKS